MPRFGLRAPIAAALTLTFAALVVAPSATADAGSTNADSLALNAHAAAEAANQAFIDGDWADVTSNADTFDAAYSELVVLRDAAALALEGAQGNNDAAQAEYDEALAAHRVVQKARNAAKSAADQAEAGIYVALDEFFAAEKAVITATEDRRTAQKARNKAKSVSDDAKESLAEAQYSLQGAEDGFNATVESVLGSPSWWTTVDDRPLTIAELFGAYESARADVDSKQGEIADAEVGVNSAQDVLDNATNLRERIAARIALLAAQAKELQLKLELRVLEIRRDAIDRALQAVDGHSRQQAVLTAQGGVTDAEGVVAETTAARIQAQENLNAADKELDDRDADVVAKQAAIGAAQALHGQKVAEQSQAADALKAAKLIVDEKFATLTAFGNTLAIKQDALDALDALLEGLAGAKQDVADRRADLTDLHTVLEQTKFSPLSQAQEGDTVALTFSIENSQLFDLSDATVSITTPLGLVADCDIADSGVVAAAATVTCTADYKVTAVDALAGDVTITFELSGYIPLGPGNPRAKAVNRTLVVVSSTTSFKVAALAVVETPDSQEATPDAEVATPAVSDGPEAEKPTPAAVTTDVNDDDAVAVTTSAELSETGSDAFGSMTDAAILALIGLGLVVVSRRKFLHQK